MLGGPPRYPGVDGRTPGCLEVVGRPYRMCGSFGRPTRMSGNGREALPEVQEF